MIYQQWPIYWYQYIAMVIFINISMVTYGRLSAMNFFISWSSSSLLECIRPCKSFVVFEKGESVDIFDKRPKACYYDQYPFPGGNKKCITAWKYLESGWSIPCRSWTGGLARRPWGAWKWVDPNGRAPLGHSHRGTETTMIIVCRWNTGGR